MTTNPKLASIKQPQQWELLASEGHVLLARIDAYRTRLKLPLAVATAAIFLAWAGYLVLWLVMFFAGYLVFRALAPARQAETKHGDGAADSTPAIENQK